MQTFPAVNPVVPRAAQGVTGLLCVAALLLDAPAAVAVALALVLVALLAPAASPVAWLARRMAPPAAALEPAAPVRFSQALAAGFLALALILLAAGAAVAGWIVVAGVAALALLSATTGLCVGCEAYRLVLAARRSRGAGADVRADLGLRGEGPWLVVLTAPGCARCEPVARAAERAAGGRPVVRVSLAERPRAATLPVRSVPALLAVGADGRLVAARAGGIGPPEIDGVLAALPA
ncbi:DUF4395 family protein [Miltoncostaea marina]|uniref:DUF4395 family protein n=1 Tax=Miltoncostaea marina TaxID=2843215 RepID=UPI001C3D83DF|nr:DUF4395 family protein [Miltoncostaea marina]